MDATKDENNSRLSESTADTHPAMEQQKMEVDSLAPLVIAKTESEQMRTDSSTSETTLLSCDTRNFTLADAIWGELHTPTLNSDDEGQQFNALFDALAPQECCSSSNNSEDCFFICDDSHYALDYDEDYDGQCEDNNDLDRSSLELVNDLFGDTDICGDELDNLVFNEDDLMEDYPPEFVVDCSSIDTSTDDSDSRRSITDDDKDSSLPSMIFGTPVPSVNQAPMAVVTPQAAAAAVAFSAHRWHFGSMMNHPARSALALQQYMNGMSIQTSVPPRMNDSIAQFRIPPQVTQQTLFQTPPTMVPPCSMNNAGSSMNGGNMMSNIAVNTMLYGSNQVLDVESNDSNSNKSSSKLGSSAKASSKTGRKRGRPRGSKNAVKAQATKRAIKTGTPVRSKSIVDADTGNVSSISPLILEGNRSGSSSVTNSNVSQKRYAPQRKITASTRRKDGSKVMASVTGSVNNSKIPSTSTSAIYVANKQAALRYTEARNRARANCTVNSPNPSSSNLCTAADKSKSKEVSLRLGKFRAKLIGKPGRNK